MNMSKTHLSESQKKDILKSFQETAMHKELKILFERLYPDNTNVYITHGQYENGKDLIILQNDPMRGMSITSVVVKMDKLSGSSNDAAVNDIRNQVDQAFDMETHIKATGKKVKSDRVIIFVFGHISNDAQEKLESYIFRHKGRYDIYSIDQITSFFSDKYPEVFFGASGVEALTKKYNDISEKLLVKNSTILENYIPPNLKSFETSKSELTCLMNTSDMKKNSDKLIDSIFGKKESIESLIKKYNQHPHFVYIEGDAGSGKSVLVFKMMQAIIDHTIKELSTDMKKRPSSIKVPFLLNATELKNGHIHDFYTILANYYSDSAVVLEPSILIIDGLDEVKKDDRYEIIRVCEEYCKGRISLILTGRKNARTRQQLDDYHYYELLPIEKSQVIQYLKKAFQKDQNLLNSIMSGIEALEHQIPLYPMALMLLIEIVQKQHEIPASISELYNRYFDIVLGKDLNKTDIDVLFSYSIKKDFLQTLAYDEFFKNKTTEINRVNFDSFLNNYVQNHSDIYSSEDFLEDLRRVAILHIEDKKVKFIHKSYLDYLIACFFDVRSLELSESGEFDRIYALYHTSLWEDVSCFYFGIKQRISIDQIQKIVDKGVDFHKENILSIALGNYFLGKLLQFAWHSEATTMQYAISIAAENSITLRDELFTFYENEIGFDLPKIISDASMLHFTELSLSSVFLRKDINALIQNRAHNLINKGIFSDDDVAFVYFTMIYTLSNIKKIPSQQTEANIKLLVDLHPKLPAEIALATFGLLSVFNKHRNIPISESTLDEIELINKKIRKKFSDFTEKLFMFKNRSLQLRLRELTKLS